jgi:hypothetical protein
MGILMPSLYDRYVAGDCEAVWAELVDLGENVREEPVLQDAMAVAAEMVDRAAHNARILHSRLIELGFQFACLERSLIWASKRSVRRLNDMEQEWGTFPLSVRKWFEKFDCVCFLPAKQAESGAEEIPSYGFDCLVVDSLKDAYKKWQKTCREYDKHPEQYYGWNPHTNPWLIIGTPASNCSDRAIGGLPSKRVDEVFYNEGAGDIYFVQELRDCFRWGGFRFLQWFAESQKPMLPGVSLPVCELVPKLTVGLKPL